MTTTPPDDSQTPMTYAAQNKIWSEMNDADMRARYAINLARTLETSLAALRSAPVQPAQELREAVKKAAAEYYTATWGKAVGALYANEAGESALSEIVFRHVAPHVEAAHRGKDA